MQKDLWQPPHFNGKKSSRRQCAQGAPIQSIDPVPWPAWFIPSPTRPSRRVAKKVLSRGKCGAVEPVELATECFRRGGMFRGALHDLLWMLHPLSAQLLGKAHVSLSRCGCKPGYVMPLFSRHRGKIKCGRVSCSWNVPRLSPSADTSLASIGLRHSDAQSQSSLHHETRGPAEKVCRSWLKKTYTPIFGLKVQASSKHNITAA